MDSLSSSKPNFVKSCLLCFTKRRSVVEHEAHEAHCTALCCAKSGECACITRLMADHNEAERLRDMGIH